MNFYYYSHLSSVASPTSSLSKKAQALQDSFDLDWLEKQLEEIKQTDIQNFNLPSNTDISEIVLKQSQPNSPSTIQQHKTSNQFSYVKLEGLQENNDQQRTPKKQYTSERKKENYRKYNTTSGFTLKEEDHFQEDELFKRLKSSQNSKKSELTKQICYYKNNKNEILVKYFGTYYTKRIIVDEEIKAAEFILLALKEYQKDPSTDKSKHEYPNFSLAYILVGEDTSPIKQIYTYNNDDNFENDSNKYLDDESLEKQEIDYESQVFYKMVELIPSNKSFGLELDIIKLTFQEHPEYIILLIEDPTKEIFYHIKVHKCGILKDCLEELNNKVSRQYSRQQYYLCLKYSCINYECCELSDTFPIEQLPLHWLVICFKNQKQPQDSSKEETSILLNNNKLNNQIIQEQQYDSSCKFLSINFMQLGTLEKMQLLYSYQEYNFFRYKKGYLKDVIVGIDYFDLYYSYIRPKKEENQVISQFQNFFQQIKNLFFKQEQKKSKRIPVACITDLKQKKEQYFEIHYELSDGFKKKLLFFSKNDDKISIKEAFTKIEYLVSKQQLL